MNRLQLIFYPKEIQRLILELDSLWDRYNSNQFVSTISCVPILKPQIDETIKTDKKDLTKIIQSGIKPEIIALQMIANLSGDWLETGKYHLTRGTLNPMTGGESLLKVYDDALDGLVKAGDIGNEDATRNKKQLRKNISETG